MEHEDTAAVLIRDDEKISVMMNEEDHLRIQGFTLGENLNDAAECAFSIDDVLQEHLAFAFDPHLKQAANLLASQNMNITEVMYACGFNNLGSFSTIFKKFYGMSPREYMNEQNAKNVE
jgi:protein-arginine kinase